MQQNKPPEGKSVPMINSFLNLCRVCPVPTEDKVSVCTMLIHKGVLQSEILPLPAFLGAWYQWVKNLRMVFLALAFYISSHFNLLLGFDLKS
ncbi:hypothetical protein CEXT_763861 [Caerostris extrusa]|uniref:Uncharacterized protein n=1 Tax=Caerostris extrusa TaxID=172846 RepID=A0AAV4N0U5_CAEEX|nr:hypothetical protein CEXT_763861 [Caerostris extrusa]